MTRSNGTSPTDRELVRFLIFLFLSLCCYAVVYLTALGCASDCFSLIYKYNTPYRVNITQDHLPNSYSYSSAPFFCQSVKVAPAAPRWGFATLYIVISILFDLVGCMFSCQFGPLTRCGLQEV